jgi:hypothetical protein
MRLPGWEGANPTLNWKRFIDNKNKEIKRLNGIYGPNSTSLTTYKEASLRACVSYVLKKALTRTST